MRRLFLSLLALLLLAGAVEAQQRDLLSIVADLGAVLEWDPLGDRGVISLGEDRISLGVGLPWALINYRLMVPIEPPVRRDGAVMLSQAAVSAIGDAVQRDRVTRAAGHLRIAAILIDPGHGGEDPGAVGTYVDGKKSVQIREKDVVLQIGLTLSRTLQAAYPDKEILLTRSDDTYVTLENRADMANKLLGRSNDTILYVSLHANSTFNRASKARGFEVWYLPPEYRRTLLDSPPGKDGTDKDIVPILNSMLEEEISVESIVLAREILSGLDRSVGALTDNRGMRQESWYVVRNAKMPAVLVEVGFMSNGEEAARLADDSYLKDIAAGLYTGISSFIARFERSGSPGAH
ncbi:MAG TPA: N-acetylmuramoyl-L-alanine amidase [Spirochaetia bacterium]|nr:N-acetylmuramoyl-L-alanine amidase [Spirochaetia bacterium]